MHKGYSISVNGEVTNKWGNKLTNHVGGDGYLRVNLYIDGVQKTLRIHRLLALEYIPNPENKATVNHINGNKLDNRLENLEWCSQKENMQHGHRTGLISPPGPRLSRNERLEIKRRIQSGESLLKLAREYGVTKQNLVSMEKKLPRTEYKRLAIEARNLEICLEYDRGGITVRQLSKKHGFQVSPVITEWLKQKRYGEP